MDRLTVARYNDVHLKVQCDQGLAYELGEYFTFTVPEAKFSPAYKNKVWDGKIRLFHTMRHTLYAGLEPKIVEFARQRDYTVEYDNQYDFAETPFSQQECDQFVAALKLPLTPKDYQLDAFIHSVRKRRAVLLSPTASGKSLIRSEEHTSELQSH